MAIADYQISAPGPVNRERLDAELRAGIANYTGFSIRPSIQGVTLHFENGTQADFDAADVIIAAHDPSVLTPTQQARANLIDVAQSAAGVSYADLTTAQLKALLAALLYQAGGLNNDLTVKPLSEWLR